MSKKHAILIIPLFALLTFIIAPAHAGSYGQWGVDLSGMDRGINPGDDFYSFVNGSWANRTVIPEDKASFGSFNLLDDESEKRVREIIEDWAKSAELDALSDEEKAASLYRTFLDEPTIEALDKKPIEPYLEPIKDVQNHEGVARSMATQFFSFGHTFFNVFISPDAKNPKQYAVYLAQSGLGLPDRSYYLEDKFKEIKDSYEKYVETMLKLIEWDDPEENAAHIVGLETKIAESHWTRAESRERDKTYNPTTIEELQKIAPEFPWQEFFKTAQLNALDQVILRQNTAIVKLAKIFGDTPLVTLKAWAAFHLADKTASMLSSRFVTTHWQFRSHVLTGAKEQRPRWKRGVGVVENLMGEVIGRTYVAKYFPPESKAKMEALVQDLLLALKARIEKLPWMSPETKENALLKLSMFSVKIGYPSKWRDYSTLDIQAGDLVGNVARGSRFDWNREIGYIGQEVDKEEWSMTPQTVNAYYNPSLNEIVFPAAILQAPFFDPNADPAVNYGAIGGVIGHEITHGFDDQGRKSDGSGLLRDWWTPEDADQFKEYAQKLGAQYEAIDLADLSGLHIDPNLTMGENIGDLGGIILGLEAYRLSLHAKTAEDLDGFNPEQRVFLGWAQVWRTLTRPERQRQLLVSDPHSPGAVRAFAPLRNIDGWYDAFGIKEGDALYIAPEDRVRIW